MEKKDLSPCEARLMKVIWDQKEEISVSRLMVLFEERFQKNYKRTTVATFLSRLIEKGYISTHRNGKMTYIHVEKDMEEYRSNLASRGIAFWYDGSPSAAISAFAKDNAISKEEIRKIREIIDDLDC